MQTNKTCREKSQSSLGRKPAGVCFGCGNSLETSQEKWVAKPRKIVSQAPTSSQQESLAQPGHGTAAAQHGAPAAARCEVNSFACSPTTLVLVPPLPGTGAQAAMQQFMWLLGAHQQCFPRAGMVSFTSAAIQLFWLPTRSTDGELSICRI